MSRMARSRDVDELDMESPARFLIVVLRYLVIAGGVWPWRKRRVLPRYLAALMGR